MKRAALVAALLAPACYRPTFPDCAVECIDDDCPVGLRCFEDRRCHRPEDTALCPAFDAVQHADAPLPADADPTAPDAPPRPDAAPAGMVLVGAGSFYMGCPSGEPLCNTYSDEAPEHQVVLSAYRIDVTEVTQAQYAACVSAGTCLAPAGFDPAARPDDPVHGLSWTQAQAYCAWAGKRLPTEAEWEKAARGTDHRIYPWGSGVSCSYANYLDCVGAVVPVGSYPTGASPYGALDMAGNVWEWVADWYDANYYRRSPSQDPTGPGSGSDRVLRSGGYLTDPIWILTVNRYHASPSSSAPTYGVRCAAAP